MRIVIIMEVFLKLSCAKRDLKAQDQVLRAQVDLLRHIATNTSTEESLQTLRKVSLDHAKQHHGILSAWEKMV